MVDDPSTVLRLMVCRKKRRQKVVNSTFTIRRCMKQNRHALDSPSLGSGPIGVDQPQDVQEFQKKNVKKSVNQKQWLWPSVLVFLLRRIFDENVRLFRLIILSSAQECYEYIRNGTCK